MSHQSIPRMERLNLTSSFWKPAAPRRVMAWDALRKPSLRIVQKGHKALIFCYFWIKPKVKSPSLEQRTQALHSMHFCKGIPSPSASAKNPNWLQPLQKQLQHDQMENQLYGYVSSTWPAANEGKVSAAAISHSGVTTLPGLCKKNLVKKEPPRRAAREKHLKPNFTDQMEKTLCQMATLPAATFSLSCRTSSR